MKETKIMNKPIPFHHEPELDRAQMTKNESLEIKYMQVNNIYDSRFL